MLRDQVDRWRASGANGAVAFFDMLTGLRPVRNVWGLSDPDVHRIDGRWVMFLGGFTNRFKVLLFAAALPEGAPLSSTEWALITDPARPDRALALAPAPPRGEWDAGGRHTPSYVRGPGPGGREEERVYYAGHASRAVTGRRSRYAIGFLARTPAGWRRHGPPVHTGTPERPSVLEPLVRCDDGVWRMWYLSAPHEVGRGELPDYRLEHVEGDDGLRWSSPRVLFSTEDGYFDNAVQRVDGHYEMVVARGTNLYGTPGYPAQGLWWLRSPRPSGRRADWTGAPVRLLDTDAEPLPWFADGGCGPSFHYGDTEADRDTMYVFFTGTRALGWPKAAAARLARLRRPPVPAPFYLATGRIAIPGFRTRDPRPAG
ncbi:hypothetical protein [Allonocardiopsis opalescens]|uniref:Glycosyl hydrolase family 43 n=1 Tax=Allonocardiopsis opalescens TaxID=1144618 RepID=A0A2T0Q6T7_9ACTN|nr:hypothetical protein [Allonocardiopsis opalescens]PRX99550.1 hypothetical protein CLV72_103151 [Allonocardiopsis opalescens]